MHLSIEIYQSDWNALNNAGTLQVRPACGVLLSPLPTCVYLYLPVVTRINSMTPQVHAEAANPNSNPINPVRMASLYR